ncbi:MAG TPA: hypothetical protein VGX21_21985 [Methylomirabilota bacterium]|jgi:hypothetical protein|nr:hypothetical protein [Methylomirabilota bacterium]
MPILFVVKRSRPALFRALRRLVAKPGLVAVLLERRRRERRLRHAPIGFDDRRALSLRQPLDADGVRTWTGLGFVVLKLHALPDLTPVGPAGRRPARRGSDAGGRPASRRGARRPRK